MASPLPALCPMSPAPACAPPEKSFLPSPSVTLYTRGVTRGVKTLKNYSILYNREQREQGTITFEISRHSLFGMNFGAAIIITVTAKLKKKK